MQNIEEKKAKKSHSIIIENRKSVIISGIEDVDKFDESIVVFFTDMGILSIKGEDLHINKLSIETGDAVVEGNIIATSYSEIESQVSNGGFLGKLFK
ncbi:MAG: sporulation protein YabP [Clostridia bacterium]